MMNHIIQDVETFTNKLKLKNDTDEYSDEHSDDERYKLFILHFFNLNSNTNFSSINNLDIMFDKNKLCDAICRFGSLSLLQYFSEQYSKHNIRTRQNRKWTLSSDALNSALLSKKLEKIVHGEKFVTC